MFEEERFILCEGINDKYFLSSIIKRRNLGSFQIRHSAECNGDKCGGRCGFGFAIDGIDLLEGFQKLRGIFIVTDNDNEHVIDIVQRNLTQYGYIAPQNSNQLGSIQGKPTAIILIPKHDHYGNLETLCLPALYDKWPQAKECVRAYLECTGAISWGKQHEICKAEVRSIISGYYENDPYKGLGYLFHEEKDLADHPCFNELSDILSNFDDIIKIGSL
jgi:hypothetical protein